MKIQWNFFIQKRKFNDIKEYREKPISIFGNIISNMEKGKLIGVLKLIYFLLKLLSDGKLVNFTPNKKKKKKWYWHCLAFKEI